MKLHICVYLHTKFQVSRIILTNFRHVVAGCEGGGEWGEVIPLPRNESLKSPPRLALNICKQMFFMFFINWPIFIVWLPLILEILGNMYIAIVCFPGCEVINFECSLIFLIRPFFYMIKKSRQKFKYLANE